MAPFPKRTGLKGGSRLCRLLYYSGLTEKNEKYLPNGRRDGKGCVFVYLKKKRPLRFNALTRT
jgi:hypothetical protein